MWRIIWSFAILFQPLSFLPVCPNEARLCHVFYNFQKFGWMSFPVWFVFMSKTFQTTRIFVYMVKEILNAFCLCIGSEYNNSVKSGCLISPHGYIMWQCTQMYVIFVYCWFIQVKWVQIEIEDCDKITCEWLNP